ncbi:hypothetical protein OAH06_03740, partial [Akkermansiaceae bacterium]|nr:hypothetical protein [Akkermansiaceae bacterium]
MNYHRASILLGWSLYAFACILDVRIHSFFFAFLLYFLSRLVLRPLKIRVEDFTIAFTVSQIIGSIYLITRYLNTGFYFGPGGDDFIFLN